MILFFDTSALVKFFHEEDGSEKVTKLIASQNNKIFPECLDIVMVIIELYILLMKQRKPLRF